MDILRHRTDLSKRGITLHSRIVGVLVGQIERAIEMSEIRCGWHPETGRQLFSVYDFIRVILGLKSEWIVYRRLADKVLDLRTTCPNVAFDQKTGYAGKESPATDMVGLLYIAYMGNCEFSHSLRIASAAHFAADIQNPLTKPDRILSQFEQVEPIAPIAIPDNFPKLAGKTQEEIYQLASDYLQVRQVAAEKLPTLIDLLDALADPAGLPEATEWFTAKTWLARNGYTMIQRQQRQFFLAIAECHRFLTVATPQKIDNVSYYSNQHDILLRTCANNVLKLAFKRTASFI